MPQNSTEVAQDEEQKSVTLVNLSMDCTGPQVGLLILMLAMQRGIHKDRDGEVSVHPPFCPITPGWGYCEQH